jgi:hypothetical protein
MIDGTIEREKDHLGNLLVWKNSTISKGQILFDALLIHGKFLFNFLK